MNMHQLQDNIIMWYYNTFSNNRNKTSYAIMRTLFLLFQLIMIILIGIVLCVIWILTPVVFLLDVIKTFLQRHIVIKLKFSLVKDEGCLYSYESKEKSSNKLKLILDLDNTLIFSSLHKLERLKSCFRIDDSYYVYKRPFLDNFLQTLSEFCDLAIYTSSTQDYADKILKYIDKNKVIREKFYRHNCVFLNNTWRKDVQNLFFDKSKILIIDDNPNCYLNLNENIIQIKLWTGDEKDDSLLKIKNIIKNFSKCGEINVRDIINFSITSEV